MNHEIPSLVTRLAQADQTWECVRSVLGGPVMILHPDLKTISLAVLLPLMSSLCYGAVIYFFFDLYTVF